jgi:putative aminopeptidase FrvX
MVRMDKIGMMVKFIKDNGKTENSMEKEKCTIQKMIPGKEENGLMEKRLKLRRTEKIA